MLKKGISLILIANLLIIGCAQASKRRVVQDKNLQKAEKVIYRYLLLCSKKQEKKALGLWVFNELDEGEKNSAKRITKELSSQKANVIYVIENSTYTKEKYDIKETTEENASFATTKIKLIDDKKLFVVDEFYFSLKKLSKTWRIIGFTQK